MKTNNNRMRNLLLTALFIVTASASSFAVPSGVSGLSNPGSTVCAKDVNGSLWCGLTKSDGTFNVYTGTVPPTTNWGAFPIHGILTIFNTACPQNSIAVDRDGPDGLGGFWLDVSCKDCVATPLGMVAWYPLDETAGTKAHEVIQATSGFPNPQNTTSPLDGSYFGSPVRLTGSYGYVGTAALFDGINDYVEAPSHPSLNFGTGDFSIDGWVKIDNPNDLTGVRVLVEKREQISNLNYRGYSLFLYNGKVSLQLAGGGYANYVSSLVVPADGLWHFVAVTVSRNSTTGGKLYLSQGIQGSFTVQTASFNPTNIMGSLDNTRPLRIGSITLSGPGSLLKGGIDEVQLFNRSLADWEIKPIIEAGRYGICKPCAMCQ
ncbi:MAG: LamG domain-containing protein [Acidobacteria bacterium]|nr:LamG domain-containing protein [Acidobacteriota bacterium]